MIMEITRNTHISGSSELEQEHELRSKQTAGDVLDKAQQPSGQERETVLIGCPSRARPSVFKQRPSQTAAEMYASSLTHEITRTRWPRSRLHFLTWGLCLAS